MKTVTLLLLLLTVPLVARAQENSQILPADFRAKIVAAIPHVEDEETESAIRDPRSIWYTRQAIGVVHQKGQGGNTAGELMGFALANVNTSGDPPDNRFPDGVGGNPNVEGSFPWSQHAGGAHAAPGVSDWKLIRLPVTNKTWPIVVFRRPVTPFFPEGQQNQLAWDWVYPNGTTFIEVIHDRGVPFEIRRRTLRGSEWEVSAVVPFPTAKSLAAAIQKEAPDWESRSNLNRLVNYLESGASLVRETLVDTNRTKKAFTSTAYMDPLPPINDDALARRLMSYPFVSREGATWRTDAAGHAAVAPTVRLQKGNQLDVLLARVQTAEVKRQELSLVAQVPRHVVGVNWRGGHIESDTMSCARCHDSSLASARTFDRNRGWYGRVRGDVSEKYTNGGSLSFHVIDTTRLPSSGNPSKELPIRPEFKPIVRVLKDSTEAERLLPAAMYHVSRSK